MTARPEIPAANAPRQSRLPIPTMVAVVGSLLLFAAAVGIMYRWDDARRTSDTAASPTPEERLHALQAEDQRLLTTYGWVDSAAGVVRIPVERAMELLVAEHGEKGPVPETPTGQVRRLPPSSIPETVRP